LYRIESPPHKCHKDLEVIFFRIFYQDTFLKFLISNLEIKVSFFYGINQTLQNKN